MNPQSEKFYDSPAPDQETRDEEAAEEVSEAVAESQASRTLGKGNTEGDPTMTTSRAEKLDKPEHLDKPEAPDDPESNKQSDKPQLVKPEPAPTAKPQPVKAFRIDFDLATGIATAVPLTVDGKVAQNAEGKDLDRLPDGASKLSWSASTPGVVVTPAVLVTPASGLTAKVTPAVPPIKVMGETVAATCQVPQPDGSILTIGGTSQPFEVILDDTGKPEAKFKLH